LPGHVVSAMIVFTLFVKTSLNQLEGEKIGRPLPGIQARLTRNIASAQGRLLPSGKGNHTSKASKA